jgi:hypothetical protein
MPVFFSGKQQKPSKFLTSYDGLYKRDQIEKKADPRDPRNRG